jgi:translation initiation factor 2 alpha subunit (eIF-2alpha)
MIGHKIFNVITAVIFQSSPTALKNCNKKIETGMNMAVAPAYKVTPAAKDVKKCISLLCMKATNLTKISSNFLCNFDKFRHTVEGRQRQSPVSKTRNRV